MKKYNEKLISNLIIIVPTLLIIIAVLSTAGILIKSKYEQFENHKNTIQKEYIEQEKKAIQEKVNVFYNSLKYEKSNLYKNLQKKLKNKTYQIHHIIEKLYENKLKKFAKRYDYETYKIGSDEFVLYKKEYFVDLVDIRNILFDLKNSFSNVSVPLSHINENAMIDITIGVSFEEENLLETADIALKNAQFNKKHFVIYNGSINSTKEIQNIQKWTKEIKKALLENRVEPFFQPIVDKEGNTIKYESLMRILKQEEEQIVIITPFHFLEIAIKTKLYPKLAEQIIEKSFKAFSNREELFSVNLSISDISNKEMITFIKQKMEQYSVSDRVIFEIVENEGINDFEIVKNFIKEIHRLNAKIAIDDFGSGYSNFSHILELNPDYIKIDGSLIKNIDTDKKSQILVKTIILFAKELQIKTIAEFVSSKEIFDICKNLGVDEFQGFYFSPPKQLSEKVPASIQV